MTKRGWLPLPAFVFDTQFARALRIKRHDAVDDAALSCCVYSRGSCRCCFGATATECRTFPTCRRMPDSSGSNCIGRGCHFVLQKLPGMSCSRGLNLMRVTVVPSNRSAPATEAFVGWGPPRHPTEKRRLLYSRRRGIDKTTPTQVVKHIHPWY